MMHSMSTVVEIESAIAKLPKKDFWELASWFDDLRNQAWDEQMEADAAAGKLDFLVAEAEHERSGGTPPASSAISAIRAIRG
jgi:hypothetical protein